MQSYEQALGSILAHSEALVPTIELVAIGDALGRVLAKSQQASINVPGYDNSAMDGYAVQCESVRENISIPVTMRIPAGSTAGVLERGSAARIFTGAKIPVGANAVILQEDSRVHDGEVAFNALPRPGQHIRKAGQDIALGETVANKGEILDAAAIGLLASIGVAAVPCFSPVRVAFFSTGDELAEPGSPLAEGQIYNSNRYFLSAMIASCGAVPVDLGRCPDNLSATIDFLQSAAAQADCVVVTGGMSVGEEDHVRAALDICGRVNFWKIAMKPGKPVVFGEIDQTTFFGLPGNPVSCYVTFFLFVIPWLRKTSQCGEWQHSLVRAMSGFYFNNTGARKNFLRVAVSAGEDARLRVSLFKNQSSGAFSSIAASNALLPVAAGESIEEGQVVDVMFLPQIPAGNLAIGSV